MEERMTVCNMSIEGGARCGYVNPDETTFAYLKGRPYAPRGAAWDDAVARWRGFASDRDAHYDDVVEIRAEDIPPTVTWGINPGQAISIDERMPTVDGSAPARPSLDRGGARVHEARRPALRSRGRRST